MDSPTVASMGAGFEPRKMARVPLSFGRAAEIDWLPASASAQDRLEVAKLQSDWSYHLRRHMAANGSLTVVQLAQTMAVNDQRLGDLLRGEYVMGLLDFVTGRRIAARGAEAGLLGDPPTAAPFHVLSARPNTMSEMPPRGRERQGRLDEALS